ncbi:MAG: DUF2279 domain-containing protein [Bacteroidota bacterium]
MRYLLLILLTIGLQSATLAQNDPFKPNYPDSVNKKRLRTVIITESVAYAGAMFGLYQLWYKGNDFTKFHFYNDTGDWLQHDKLGHTYAAYQQGVLGYHALRWAGVDEKKAAIFGGGLGILMQTPIEILDGHSEAWGASPGDLVANTAGSLLFIGQQLAWHDQRIKMKFSFTPSPYAELRPGKLGDSFWSEMVQDYNGQTIWFSASPASFLGETKLPAWLCIAGGYGIDGVLDNSENPERFSDYRRQRQFYLSLDIDFTRIKTRSRFLRTLFVGLNMLKVPAPAIEFNQHGKTKFRPFFF